MARLGLQHPIIQAPMAGTSTPQLAAAVSEAAALSSVGIGADHLEQAQQHITQTQALTQRLGHNECGVYAEVIAAGTVGVGDTITVEQPKLL